MQRQQKHRIGRLFDSFVKGRFEEFAAGCADDLILTVRGSEPAPVHLQGSDIPDWHGSLQALSPGALRTSVEVAQVDGPNATVILRHSFARHGVDYHLELVNLLTFRDGLLAEWSSYPLDLGEYSRAWRTHELSMGVRS
jgi:ketosteroid isomerase-like protein